MVYYGLLIGLVLVTPFIFISSDFDITCVICIVYAASIYYLVCVRDVSVLRSMMSFACIVHIPIVHYYYYHYYYVFFVFALVN